MLTSVHKSQLKWTILHLTIVSFCLVSVLTEDDLKPAEERDLGGEGVRNKNGTPPTLFNPLNVLPNILFKKQTKVKNSDILTDPIKVDPQECVETRFMYPFHPVHTFPDTNKYTEMKSNTQCNWTFIGSEACVPQLSCPTFQLPPDCKKDYMHVVDGDKGEQIFCGTSGPNNTIAANSLRDLFIMVKGTDQLTSQNFKCEIKCTHRGVGTPLTADFKPKTEPKCKCGQKPSSDRIVNGYAGKKSEFPWLVAMVEAKTRQPFCGASIINDRMVLTAAHCFKGKYMDYRRIQLIMEGEILDIMPNAGVLIEKPEPKIYSPEVLARLDKGNGSVRYNVEEVFIHPLYVSETNDFDTAIIQTVEKIDIAWKGQTPACLPKLGSYNLTYAYKPAIVAGWGLGSADATGTNTQLEKLNVTVFDQKVCKQLYTHRVNKRMMCAGYREGGRDSCMGDSGGPLVLESELKVWTQIGTVSWGEGCAMANNPGVYYRTTETGQWINYISNSRGATWCERPRPQPIPTQPEPNKTQLEPNRTQPVQNSTVGH